MHRIIPVFFISALLFGSMLTACSPTEPMPKVAESQREVLKNAEKAAASMEQSAAKMQHDIDAQSE